ncbi:MAG: AAA family ATPase [Acidobacteriota bacterium]|nr:AAA family ATPase [Acidobacteriota bacterium]
MAHLLGIRIQNYRSLKDLTLGRIGYGKGQPLPPIMCFIGPNGSGKSSLLDSFAFMADCLAEGVEAACDKPHRGGFSRLRTQSSTEPIKFEIYFKQRTQSRPITYAFEIEESNGVPIVVSERLQQRRKGQKHGRPFSFVNLNHGKGEVWSGQSTDREEGNEKHEVSLDDPGRLGITSLGQFKEHERILGLRAYMENWYLSYFVPDAARQLPIAGAQKHLNRSGDNLGNVIQYLQRSHPDRFQTILEKISKRIPGIQTIGFHKSEDNRILLRFNERGYTDPFYQQSMSDGTLKMFAYLLLLEDPEPHSFIGIEEPENGLYHKLLEQLAREFRRHAEQSANKTQLLITTHSPYFVDALKPDQVWLLEKDDNGETQARRTADIPTIEALKAEGIPLGSLWYSNHFEERFRG